MVLINSKTFEHRLWKFFLFDPEIYHSGTYFALKMSVCRCVRIVTNFISFDIKCQCYTGLNEQIEYIINSRFWQSVDFMNQVAVDHVNRWVVAFWDQITHDFNPLLKRSDPALEQVGRICCCSILIFWIQYKYANLFSWNKTSE